METTKCLIIGSGPAGYTAAIYACRANLSPIVIEGPAPGGQLLQTTEVENFPGYPQGVTGNQLIEDCRNQALRFNADIRPGTVTNVDTTARPFVVTLADGTTIAAQTIIAATGATARYLGLPDEEKYQGLGVSACATCDGFFYRNRVVAVVGGGDTACEEALYLAGLAKKVYLIVRKPFLRASKIMQERALNNPKIEVLFNTNTEGLFGEEYVEGAHVVEHLGTPDERHYDIAIDGFFLAIGHKPCSDFFGGAVETDQAGFIKTNSPSTATNIPGIFAAGDVADPAYRQAIVAAASGCRAAIDAEHFLLANA